MTDNLINTGLNGVVFEAKGIEYDYPGDIPALRDIGFKINAGEKVALVGVNGSGKSTLLKMMDGLIFASKGEMMVFGRRLSEKGVKNDGFNMEFRRRVGIVFQDPEVQLFSPTVWDEVTFGPLQLGITKEEVVARAAGVLDLLNLTHLKDRPPYFLSGGEKKKVALASVLSLQPEILLLDEPTTGLDPRSQGHLIDFLLHWAGHGRTLIFSTQDLDMVEEIATRVIVMDDKHHVVADNEPKILIYDSGFLLRNNLVHEHSHRHKEMIHRHPHQHDHIHND